jgi:hypothetical protein
MSGRYRLLRPVSNRGTARVEQISGRISVSKFIRFSIHRISLWGFLFVLWFSSMFRSSLSEQRPVAQRVLTWEVTMGGAGLVQFGQTCAVFVGKLSSGDFFAGLEAKETPTGREYTKGSHRVYEFPEQVEVSVFTSVLNCRGNMPIPPPQGALEKLRIRADWKTGLETRPVKKLTWILRQPSIEEWIERPENKALERLGIYADGTGVRILALTIVDEHIPLRDSLVVTILSAEGKQVTRLSARL